MKLKSCERIAIILLWCVYFGLTFLHISCKEDSFFLQEEDTYPRKLWTDTLKSVEYNPSNSAWLSDTWFCEFENKRTLTFYDQPPEGFLLDAEYTLWEISSIAVELRLVKKKQEVQK